MSATDWERFLLTSGRYRITEDDSVQAAKVYGRPSRTLKVIYAILACGLLLLFLMGPTTSRGIVALGALLGGAVGVVFMQTVMAPALKGRSYRRNSLLHNEYTVEISDQDIRILTVSTDAKLTANRVTRWKKVRDIFLFMFRDAFTLQYQNESSTAALN